MELRIELHDKASREMLSRVDAGVRKAVHDALWSGARDLMDAERRAAPKAFSTLANSIRAEEIGYLHLRVSTGTNYARPVEEGRKPGKMPGMANGLMEWVRQKTRAVGKALDRLTFVIARAIGRRGIRPQPYAKPSFESQKDRIVARVQEAARRAALEAQGV